MDNELDPKRENEEAIDTNEEAVTGRSDDEEEFEDAEDVDEEDDVEADESGVEG